MVQLSSRLAFIVFLFAMSGCSWFASSRTVISVGDLKFSEKYYSTRLVEKLKSMDGIHIKDKTLVDQIKQSLTAELISEGLLLNWAKQNKVEASRDEINTMLKDLLSTSDGQLSEDILKEANANKALLEDSLGIQILKKHLLEALSKEVSVSEQEIQSYYRDHQSQFKKGRIHLKQIFLAKEAEAESVLKFLHSGKFSFEDLAKKYSMGPEASKGGDMGWLDSGAGPQIDALFNRSPGIYDKIIASPQGFHIFKVIEVQRPALQPVSQVKNGIIRSIKEYKVEGAYLHWTEEQAKKTQIKVNEGLVKALSPSYQETP